MLRRCVLALTVMAFLPMGVRGADRPLVIKRNGGWNWFSNNRALMDGDRLIVGSVAGTEGAGAAAGDVQITVFYLRTRAAVTVTLDAAATADAKVATAAAPSDDHMVSVVLKRPDGRYVAVWQRHDVDALMRWRISTRPEDPTSWLPMQTVSANTIDKNGICFSNVFYLSSEHRVYNLVRSVGYDPNYLVSDDGGDQFHYGGHIMMWENPEGHGLGRPYICYACNGSDTIYFATTEDHPKDMNTGILAGYIQGGALYRSEGMRVGALGTTSETSIKPTDFTRIFQGSADAVAYINDIQLIPAGHPGAGHPHVVFSVREDPAGTDIRYFYARFGSGDPADKAWHTREAAFAGSTIYAEESSYAGLACLDPADPDRMYLSANSDPKTGKPLVSAADHQRHYELFEGRTKDAGASWSFTPVTQDSAFDNIRPLAVAAADEPAFPHQHVLLWLQGTMTTYKNYDLNIVVRIDPKIGE